MYCVNTKTIKIDELNIFVIHFVFYFNTSLIFFSWFNLSVKFNTELLEYIFKNIYKYQKSYMVLSMYNSCV